jgi:uncharacterized integral membrane protein
VTTPDQNPELGPVTDPHLAAPEAAPGIAQPGSIEPAQVPVPDSDPTERRAAPGHPAPTTPLPSRLGAMWVAAVLFALVLLLLLIFILQNSQRVEVSFFGAHGHTPMGVALLLAAVFGILLVAIPGSARILQLRMRDRRRRRRATNATKAEVKAAEHAAADGTSR